MIGGTPEAAELYKLAIRQARARIHTSIPGYVEKVHTSAERKGQWIDVQPAIKASIRDVDGKLVEEDLPKLQMVPVGHMQGGGFFASVPLKVGDHVLLQFSEASLDQWIQKGKTGRAQTVSPGHAERHGLNGAIALPVGPPTRLSVLADVDADDMVIGLDGTAGAQVRITAGGEIHLGGSAEYVALAARVLSELNAIRSEMQTELNAIRAAHDSHTHITTATIGLAPVGIIAPTAAPLTPTTIAGASAVAASTTKAG